MLQKTNNQSTLKTTGLKHAGVGGMRMSACSCLIHHTRAALVTGRDICSCPGFDLEDYATTYRATRDAYLKAANELKLATGPYKAARNAYVAATATYTKSLYE